MTSTITRSLGVALATLAIAAPAATAMPSLDGESSGTPAAQPYQDLRNPDQQAPAPPARQDLRNPDNRVPAIPSGLPQTMKPVVLTKPAPVADDGVSPFVIIGPSLVLIAMLAGGVIYARSARLARA